MDILARTHTTETRTSRAKRWSWIVAGSLGAAASLAIALPLLSPETEAHPVQNVAVQDVAIAVDAAPVAATPAVATAAANIADCDKQAWPYIADKCLQRDTPSPAGRTVRVISLDRDAPAIVPLPAALRPAVTAAEPAKPATRTNRRASR